MYLGVDGSCEVCKGVLLVSLGQGRGWVEQWLRCHHRGVHGRHAGPLVLD